VILVGSQSRIISSIDQMPDSDVAIVFGTLVNDSGVVTPLLKERLEAGKLMLQAGKCERIVVSNTRNAADVMAKYLYAAGVSPALVEVDTQAYKTPDTCLYEKRTHSEDRKIIFISQGFHLPRLLFQCKNACLEGVAFPAEAVNAVDRSDSFVTKLIVRTERYTREAGLVWLVCLNIY